MTETEFFNELLEPYTYGGGFICNRKVLPHETNPTNGSEEPTGNGLLYTSLAYILKAKLFPENGFDRKYFRLIEQCFVERGLVARSPWKINKGDQVGIDDYCAMFAALKYGRKAEMMTALDILNYGWRNNWVYNSENPGRFSWKAAFFRFPQLIAQAHWAVGLAAPVWTEWWVYWVLKLARTKKKDDQDGHMLTWLLSETIPAEHWLQKERERWRSWYMGQFPGEHHRIAERVLESNHPIGQYFLF